MSTDKTVDKKLPVTIRYERLSWEQMANIVWDIWNETKRRNPP